MTIKKFTVLSNHTDRPREFLVRLVEQGDAYGPAMDRLPSLSNQVHNEERAVVEVYDRTLSPSGFSDTDGDYLGVLTATYYLDLLLSRKGGGTVPMNMHT